MSLEKIQYLERKVRELEKENSSLKSIVDSYNTNMEVSLNSVPECIIIFDSKGRVIHINDGFENIFEQKKDKYFNYPIWEIEATLTDKKDKETLENLEKKYLNIFENNEVKTSNDEHIEENIKVPSGKTKDIFVGFIYSPFGRGDYHGVVIRDITDYKNYKNVYVNIVENLIQGLIIIQDGLIVFHNERFLKQTEISKEKIREMSIEDLINYLHPDDRIIATKRFSEVLNNRFKNSIIEYRFRKDNGETAFFEVYSESHNYNGKPAVFITVFDVTGRKKLETEVAKSEVKYRSVVKNLPFGYYRFNLEGELLEANPAWEKMFSLNVKDFLGKKLTDFVDEKHKKNFKKNFDKARTGYNVRDEFSYEENGKKLEFIYKFQPVVMNDKIVAVDGFIEDVTKIREVERMKLEAEKKLEHTMHLATIGGISAGITHEITQPLNALMIAADSIIYHKNNDMYMSEVEIYDKVEFITKQSQRISDKIHQLRSMIRQDDGEVNNKLNLNEIIKKSISTIKSQLIDKDISIHLNLSKNDTFIWASRIKLEQIIFNLINFSEILFKKSEPPKDIYIETKKQKNSVVLYYGDSSDIVDTSFKEKIYKPFSKGDDEKWYRGLNLFIVNNIVTQVNGTLNIIKTPKRKFKLTFNS